MRVAIILLLFTSSVFAQMRGTRGGGFRGGFGHHGGVIHHPGVVFHGGARPLSPIPQVGRPFFPGVPASVTSLGPCGFTPCFQPFFKHGFRRFGRASFFGGGFVGAYPVAVPVPTYADYVTQPQPVVQQPTLPQRLEIVIVDRRGEKQDDSEPTEPERVNPKHDDDPAAPSVPAIFIFKDGSRKELANYAIMRGQLIDVTDGKLFRIGPLEALDRGKTLEANAKAGREIQLP